MYLGWNDPLKDRAGDISYLFFSVNKSHEKTQTNNLLG